MNDINKPIIFERRNSRAVTTIPHHIESDADLADRLLSVSALNSHIALAAAIETDLLMMKLGVLPREAKGA